MKRDTLDETIEKLRSVNHEVRAAGLHELLGTPRSRLIPELERVLSDLDERTRADVIMGMVGVAEAHPVLLRHLAGDMSPHVRKACLMALDGSDPAVEGALIRAVEDKHTGVVTLAISRLARSSSTAARVALRANLEHPSWSVRWRAACGLIEQGIVDDTVIQSLQSLCQDREATEHDARISFWRAADEAQQSPEAARIDEPTTNEALRRAIAIYNAGQET